MRIPGTSHELFAAYYEHADGSLQPLGLFLSWCDAMQKVTEVARINGLLPLLSVELLPLGHGRFARGPFHIDMI